MLKREIKFRVWSKAKKKFFNSYKGKGLIFAFGSDRQMEEGGCYDLEQCLSFGDIIQQFVGLKDKDGKEIYEGDIVEYYLDGNLFQDEVIWEHFGWVLRDFQVKSSFPLTNGLEYKIIGNILESDIKRLAESRVE